MFDLLSCFSTTVGHAADGIAATFRVVDGYATTDESADATFDGDEVTAPGDGSVSDLLVRPAPKRRACTTV